MPGIRALRRCQIGVEALAGAATDIPTTWWRGEGVLKDNLKIMHPEENIGVLGPTTLGYIPETGGEIELSAGASFEQLPYVFNSAWYHVAPTTDTGSGIIRAWTVQQSDTDLYATTDLDTLVIEGGDNQGAEIAHFGFVREFTLSGKWGEGWQISATVETRAPAPATFTASLAIPTPNEIALFGNTLFYIDPSTDTPGTTLISKTLLSATLKAKTGWISYGAADGRLDFSDIKKTGDEMTLEVVFEHNATGVTEKAAWRALTEKALYLITTGSTLASGGTYTKKTLKQTYIGTYESFDKLDEQDGNDIYKATFRIAYSASAGAKASFVVVNEVAALP
jgi:hypothetical protein